MDFVFNIFKGIAIGAGAILPGISSGVLCVIFGIYEKMIDSILSIFKDFKKSFLYLLPFIIGIAIGVVLFGNILKYLFSSFENASKTLFMGLILGSIPSLIKEAKGENKSFKLHYLIYTIITFLIGFILFRLEGNISNFIVSNADTSFSFLIFAGFVMSIGIVVPGVSSTVLLMCLGVYYTYLSGIATLNFNILIPMGIGLVIGSVIFLILIKFLLNRFHNPTYYSIIGFAMSSIFVLMPNISFDSGSIIYFILFSIGLYLPFGIEKHFGRTKETYKKYSKK